MKQFDPEAARLIRNALDCIEQNRYGVRGGQGRTSGDVWKDARGLFWLLLFLAAALIGLYGGNLIWVAVQ